MQDELFKKKTECIKLQNHLDSTSESLRKIVDYEITTSSLTENKELNQAMDAQKAINRYFYFVLLNKNKTILISVCTIIIDIF